MFALFSPRSPVLYFIGELFEILGQTFAPGSILGGSEIGPAAIPFSLRPQFLRSLQFAIPDATVQSYSRSRLIVPYRRAKSVGNPLRTRELSDGQFRPA